jgi:hypothetical protein
MNRMVPWLMMLTLGAGLCAQPQASNWILGTNLEEKKVVLKIGVDSAYSIELPNPTMDWVGFEALSSISDKEGDLLFYSNNYATYNKDHSILVGSEDINPYSGVVQSSITNGCLFLPFPGDTAQRYYVFLSMKEGSWHEEHQFLKWSMVDRQLDRGRGGIVDSFKSRNVWGFRVIEKLVAIKHANGRDWWIIGRKANVEDSSSHAPGSHVFCMALLSPDGIADFGEQWSPVYVPSPFGELSASKDGSLLAEAIPGIPPYQETRVALYTFDRCSGEIDFQDSSSVNIPGAKALYGIAFCPLKKRLYVTTSEFRSRLYQFTISDGVLDSVVEIFRAPWDPGALQSTGQLELGMDGKVYVVIRHSRFTPESHPFNTHLAVIHEPSKFGYACLFDTFAISVGVTCSFLGLPPQPNYALGALEGSGCDTLGSTSSAEGPAPVPDWRVYPNPADHRLWFEGLSPGDSWTMVDALGRLVREGERPEPRHAVDVSDVGNGIYWIRVRKASGISESRTVVISRP